MAANDCRRATAPLSPNTGPCTGPECEVGARRGVLLIGLTLSICATRVEGEWKVDVWEETSWLHGSRGSASVAGWPL